ncbi:MAG: DsbA family protein [Dehalococcoidia bacterium]
MSKFDIFIDYTCPWVAQIFPWIMDVLRKDNTYQVSWKSFPLEQINNQDDGWKCWDQSEDYISRGLWALRGGIASRMLGEQHHNKYMAMILNEKHIKHNDVRTRDSIINISKELDFPTKFIDLMDEKSRLKEISEDYQYAESLGIFGTPTFLFENKYVAFLKTFTPPKDDSISFFNNFYQMAESRSYFGELKRPQPPWPRYAKD